VKLMRDEEHRPIPEIASLFKVSEKTIRRVV
jgi:DeoR/GlpR family transcriptional regulator of sugar metabolism